MSIKNLFQQESESVTEQPVKIPFDFTNRDSIPKGKDPGDCIVIKPITVRTWFRIRPLLLEIEKEDIDKIHGLGLGADDYMTKPFSPSELVARVKAHINRYESLTEKSSEKTAKNETIEVGDLKIDRTARRVFVRGEEKNLTSKEFDLLYFLAKNPNHVFPKEELFQQIWDVGPIGENGMVGDIATVTVHIKKIREKIEQDTSNPEYIETIWGVGYRFRAN